MSVEYIASVDIGKELTEKEAEDLCEARKENEMSMHDSGRCLLSVWRKSMWSVDSKRIVKIDIDEINAAYKRAIEIYGDRAEIIFSLTVN